MSYNGYVCFKSEKGVIEGFTGDKFKTADGKSVENMSLILGFNHPLHRDYHMDTGEPQGESHKETHVTIQADASVAELYKALCKQQRFDEVKFYFFSEGSGDRGGSKTDMKKHNAFTLTMMGARLTHMNLQKHPGADETVSLTFRATAHRYEDHDSKQESDHDSLKD